VTEKAEEMYAERMRVETEAVKAELRVDAPASARATLEEMVDEAARRDARERGKP
jgi:hypothetical protein